MGSKLLSYYQANPPDLQKRAYYQKMGMRTSDAELGDPTQGKMLTVPPPPRSSNISIEDGDSRADWLNKITQELEPNSVMSLEETQRTDISQPLSLVTPLVWMPGVLRSQGAWATVMKETKDGIIYGAPGVELISADSSELPGLMQEEQGLENQILEKERLIQELERTITKQRILNEKLILKTRKQAKHLSGSIDKARFLEQKRHDREVSEKISPLRSELHSLKDDMRTLKKAMNARVKKAYAQDNFLSSYNSVMQRFQDEAKANAQAEQARLLDKVGALERRILRESRYKMALKQRTETAENAAEKRWNDAEGKIPQLEREILFSNIKLDQNKRLSVDKMHRHKRDIEHYTSAVRKENEARIRAEKENEDLRRQVSDLKFQLRTTAGRGGQPRNSSGSVSPVSHGHRQSISPVGGHRPSIGSKEHKGAQEGRAAASAYGGNRGSLSQTPSSNQRGTIASPAPGKHRAAIAGD